MTLTTESSDSMSMISERRCLGQCHLTYTGAPLTSSHLFASRLIRALAAEAHEGLLEKPGYLNMLLLHNLARTQPLPNQRSTQVSPRFVPSQPPNRSD